MQRRRRAGRAATTCRAPALRRQRRRAAQPRGGACGASEALGPADPRQLVADRDRRDHDRQLRRDATSSPGSMGRPLPGIEAAIVRRDDDGEPSSRRRVRIDRAGRRGRAGAAAGLAVDVPRLPARRRALPRSASPAAGTSPATSPGATPTATSGSSAAADDVIKSAGPPDRPVRGRERADGAPGRRRGRRDRQARPDRRRDRQGVRRAASRATTRATTLRRELLGFARKRLGAAVAPKEIDVRRRTCRRPAAARSCAGCSRPASSACPRATVDAGGGA